LHRRYKVPVLQTERSERSRSAPTITTKQVKYYDEDEQVWKIGEVIVDE